MYNVSDQAKYLSENTSLIEARSFPKVVLMGNSITEVWPIKRPNFFNENNFLGRGISGQTTAQMLLRFREDVIKLNPKVVVILAGINDLAQNLGYVPIENIADNIKSMSDLALANDIEVILCSVLPAKDFPWRLGLKPAGKIVELNSKIKRYAVAKGLNYVDFHTAMKDKEDGLKVPEFTTSNDLVHPNEAGYVLMERLLFPVIKEVLAH